MITILVLWFLLAVLGTFWFLAALYLSAQSAISNQQSTISNLPSRTTDHGPRTTDTFAGSFHNAGLETRAPFEAGSDVAAVRSTSTERSGTRLSHTQRSTSAASVASASFFSGEFRNAAVAQERTERTEGGKQNSVSSVTSCSNPERFTTRAGMVPAVVDAAMEDSASHRAPQCPSARVNFLPQRRQGAKTPNQRGTRNAERGMKKSFPARVFAFFPRLCVKSCLLTLNPRLLR